MIESIVCLIFFTIFFEKKYQIILFWINDIYKDYCNIKILYGVFLNRKNPKRNGTSIEKWLVCILGTHYFYLFVIESSDNELNWFNDHASMATVFKKRDRY